MGIAINEINYEKLLQMEAGEELDIVLMFLKHPDVKFHKDSQGQWWGDYGKDGFRNMQVDPTRYSEFFDSALMLIYERDDLTWAVSGNGINTTARIIDGKWQHFTGSAGPTDVALAFVRAYIRLVADLPEE